MKIILSTLAIFTERIHATGWLMWIGGTFGALIGFVFGTETMAIAFVLLLMLDFVSGIMAAMKRGELITSRRMREMWIKWITYLVVLLTASCTELIITTGWVLAAALGWIGLSEVVSILENCECALGKKIPFLKRIRKILDALRGTECDTK